VLQIQPDASSDSFYTAVYLDNNNAAKSLVAGDIYKFRVTARNEVGDSHASSSFSAMAASLPGKPGKPQRVVSSETSVTI
jgi:hypothetical protein